MRSYSVAIRTLGTSVETLRKTVESVHAQSVPPEKICVYIAHGYQRPDFTIGKEEYIWVEKGMFLQRALRYNEINSECILMLDDDIYLEKNIVKRMLEAMDTMNLDCIGGDCFKNQDLPFIKKIYYILTSWALPFCSRKWALRIGRSGASFYNNNPKQRAYMSQSAVGGCSLWKKESFLSIRSEDEKWIENKFFPWGEDMLIFNKLYKNGGRLGFLYDDGILNLDAGTASSIYHRDTKGFYIRNYNSYLIWYRSCYALPSLGMPSRIFTLLCYIFRYLICFGSVVVAMIFYRNTAILKNSLRGTFDAIKYSRSETFRTIPPYIINNRI